MGKIWAAVRPFSYQSIAVDSIDALRQPIDGAEAEIVQLGKGRLRGRLTRATIGDVGFSRGSFSLPLRGSGIFSQTRLTIGILLESAQPMRELLGRPVLPGDILTIPPGQDHHSVYAGPASYLGLTIDPVELALLFGSEGPFSDVEYWLERHHYRSTTPETCLAVRRRLQTVFARLARGKPLHASLADYLKRVVVEEFARPLVGASVPETSATIASTINVVRQVECYVDARWHRPVHISEICSNLKISRRTLHRCFEDVLGVGPGTFLRYKRLSAVHSALRNLDPKVTHVTQVATEFGFLELSRFARQYRGLFGEYPHETLRG
jgi:AraC-like DNA-binding protein